jgi:hypothetical protein
MNTTTFTTTAKRLIQAKNLQHTDSPQTLSWKDEADGWTYTFHAHWIRDKDGEVWHDIHAIARKKGERHTFSVWFETHGDDYEAV